MRRLGLPLATFLTLVMSVTARENSPDGASPRRGHPPFPRAILTGARVPVESGGNGALSRGAFTGPDRRFRRLQGKGFWARGGGGLLMRGDGRGVEISAPSRSGLPWRLSLGLTGFGRDGQVEAVRPGTPGIRGDGLEIGRTGLTESYRSADSGMEYGFRIERPPSDGIGRRPVSLEMTLGGGWNAAADEIDGSIWLHDSLGGGVLQASRLRGTDAAGREIPVELVPGDGLIQLRIDDSEAFYPIQIDSLLTVPSESLVGETAGDGFGRSVASAGDVNGDGYGDVIVGAPQYDNGEFRFGRAYLFAGSAEGIGSAPVWVAEGGDVGYGFATVVAGAGDLNGDGFGDVVVSGAGGAHVYFGSAAGLSSTPDWSSPVPEGAEGVGVAVAGAGDVNGDGFSDLLVGGPQVWVGVSVPGRAELYLGSDSGPGSIPVWTSEGDQPGAAFGYALSAAGDVNSDGYGDVIIGEPGFDFPEPIDRFNAGKVLVYLGTPSGLPATASWESSGVNRFAFLGFSVSGAGDVNNDGYDDILMGSFRGFSGEAGIAQACLGSPSGPAASPAWTRTGDHLNAHLGTVLAGAGDLNGDGYADVVIGEPDYDRSFNEESVGRAYVFRGSTAGLEVDPSWFAEGNSLFDMLGSAVGPAGDVNGDGFGDLLVSTADHASGMGRVLVYAGAPDNRPPEARITAPAQVECSSPAGAMLGLSGSPSSDPDSTPGTQDDIRMFEWFEHYGGPGQALLGTGESLSVTLPRGDHLLTLRVTDASGAPGTAEALVRVADTTPPQLTLALSPSLLWPPTHRMVNIHATVGASDACGSAETMLMFIASDELDDAPGSADGNTLMDIQEASPGTADFDFKLRSERSEAGDGRVYLVSYRALDAAGNSSISAAFVTVPYSLKGLGGHNEGLRPKDRRIRKSPTITPRP